MKYAPYAVVIACIIIVAVAFAGGCRRDKDQSTAPPQRYEISAGSNFIVRPMEEVSILADIHMPDRFAPVRATVTVKPGVWIVPEGILTVTGDNRTICKGDFEEAAK